MAPVNRYKNLYDFWGEQLYRELYKNNDLVISLASVEYETIEGVKQFNIGGYHFREDLSTDEKLVFELVK